MSVFVFFRSSDRGALEESDTKCTVAWVRDLRSGKTSIVLNAPQSIVQRLSLQQLLYGSTTADVPVFAWHFTAGTTILE
jgi:hypothetical protein